MATDELYLPRPEEVTVQDITISSPLFRTLSRYMGFECDEISKEYMLCREELRDPRSCLDLGRQLTSCGLKFAQEVKKTCKDEAEAVGRCMEWNSSDISFDLCRREEKIFDHCMQNKMGKIKPPFGYFSQVRIHNSERQKPVAQVPEFPDKPRALPEDHPALKEHPKFGPRMFFS